MPTNPLKKAGKDLHLTSRLSALEWARLAREKNLPKHAAAWEQAARDGWDEAHYRPDED
jgi:hypothetical protein